MKFWLKLLVLVIIGVLVVAMALANKEIVQVSANPFGTPDKALSIGVPLFLVMFAMFMAGMVFGGVLTWFGQGKHRRAARQAKAEAASLRTQVARPEATGSAVTTTFSVA
ncbi:MAG: DUF1049 domain-containing protein [Hyphomicrobiales bacterium]|nr:DUF1049 domain-containing protein [Hyphomicrobiales bacterium]